MFKLILTVAILNFVITDTYSQKKQGIPQKKTTSIKYDEQKAEDLLFDYYSFYNRDYVYRDKKIRRVSGNVFYISLQERSKEKDDISAGGEVFFTKEDNSFFWRSKVWILTINSSTKYTFKEKEQ